MNDLYLIHGKKIQEEIIIREICEKLCLEIF